jgi:hypothetical protein
MSRLRLAITLGAVAVAFVGVAAWRYAPRASAGPCVVEMGPSALPDVPETSGLAVGRRQPVLWTHNDSGNDTDLFAVDEAGRTAARVRVPVAMRDWEDVSAGRCPAGDCLYVADIGDNARRRPQVFLHRFPEPAAGSAVAATETFTLTYPDGPHNAEGLFLLGEEAFVVTKDRKATVYRSGPLPSGGGAITLRQVGNFGLETVTDAETSTDGASVVVRTPDLASLHRASDILKGNMRPYATIRLDAFREAQGEGVAMRGDALYLSSEAGHLSVAGSLLRLRCRLPTP